MTSPRYNAYKYSDYLTISGRPTEDTTIYLSASSYIFARSLVDTCQNRRTGVTDEQVLVARGKRVGGTGTLGE